MATKTAAKMLHYQRYIGIFLIIIGLPILFVPGPQTEFPLLIGLFTLFTSFEKVEDERSVNIKMSSLYIGFVFAYGFKMLNGSLYSWKIVPYNLKEINHFIILVLAITVPVYHLRLRGKG